jgi:hypothetical protein
MTEIELLQRLRADAVRELDRVKMLAGILPFTYLEWLDQRAAKLNDTIRQFDQAWPESRPSKRKHRLVASALVFCSLLAVTFLRAPCAG